MGALLCKLKQKQGKKLDKIKMGVSEVAANPYEYDFSGKTPIKFKPDYKLEADEIFYIEKPKEKIASPEFLNKFCDNLTAYEQIKSEEWTHVDFLIYSEEKGNYYQRIIGKKYLEHKVSFKFFEGAPEIKKEQQGITIAESPDAIYKFEEDRLYFKDFFVASKIFKNLDSLYREATESEINGFFNQKFIKREATFGNEKITSHKRKKISLILHKLDGVDRKKIENMQKYAKKYCDLAFEDGKFLVNNNENLEDLISVIGETFYTSELSGEKRKSNSSRVIQ